MAGLIIAMIIEAEWVAELPCPPVPDEGTRLLFLQKLIEEKGSDKRYRFRGVEPEPNLAVPASQDPKDALASARAAGVPTEVIEVPRLEDGTSVLFRKGRFEIKSETAPLLAEVVALWQKVCGAGAGAAGSAAGTSFSTRQPLKAVSRSYTLLFRALDFLSGLYDAVPGFEVKLEAEKSPRILEAPGDNEPCAKCGGRHPPDLCERVRAIGRVEALESVGRTFKDGTRIAVNLFGMELELRGPSLEPLRKLLADWRAHEKKPWKL